MFSNADTSFKRSPLSFPCSQIETNGTTVVKFFAWCYAASDSETKCTSTRDKLLVLLVGLCINTRGILLRWPVMLTKVGRVVHFPWVPLWSICAGRHRSRRRQSPQTFGSPQSAANPVSQWTQRTNQSITAQPYDLGRNRDNKVSLFIWGDQVIWRDIAIFVFTSCLPFQHHQAQKKHNYF